MNEKLAASALSSNWQASGIQAGDTVLLHSNIMRTLRGARLPDRQGAPAIILQSWLEAVGPAGTLLLPTFNFGFAQGRGFDMRQTRSEMGILTETARLWPGVVRTGHPVYSFAAFGARAAELRGLANLSGYGRDSPFGWLRRVNGKIAVLDCPDQEAMTFYHHVEEMEQVDYRYHKPFTGKYTDAAGTTTERTFYIYVRNLDRNVITKVGGMEELLWQDGLYSGNRPGCGNGLRTIGAADIYLRTAQIIKSGQARGHLYEESGPP